MSSSIFSSDTTRPWRRFLATVFATAVGVGGLVYGWVVVIDPFDTLKLSPPLDRVPIATNARYSFPALARSAEFDSVVIGTSTSRLLQPEKLDALFGVRFANLSMNSATAFEQTRILDVFARHNPQAKVVLLGADIVWCETGTDYARYTPRPFPEWMYDADPWNDYLQHFNFYTLEQTGRQFLTMIGRRPIKYGRDGYTNFLPDDDAYDLEKVRAGIWGDRPREIVPVLPSVRLTDRERAALTFPTHALLYEALAGLPSETEKIVYFVPYHVAQQPLPGSRGAAVWAECKSRIAVIADRIPNTRVVDFMIASPMTREDRNYWDSLHYSSGVADQLAGLLARAANGGAPDPVYRILAPGQSDGVAVR